MSDGYCKKCDSVHMTDALGYPTCCGETTNNLWWLSLDELLRLMGQGKLTKEDILADAERNVRIYGDCRDGSGDQARYYLKNVKKALGVE